MVPTIGRRMWAFMTPRLMEVSGLTSRDCELPFDAGVILVHSTGKMVNVVITDHVGKTIALQSVPVRSEEDPLDNGVLLKDRFYYDVWVEWMPYQQQQAAKSANAITEQPSDIVEKAELYDKLIALASQTNPDYFNGENTVAEAMHKLLWDHAGEL